MAKREVNIKLNVDAKKAVKSTEDVNKGFKKVDKSAGKAKESVGGFSQGLDTVGGGLSAAAAGAGKLLTSFKAIILSPVGLVIAAIAAALFAVKTAFESSEAGQNKFNKYMGILGALLGNLMDLLADFGEMIIEAFENPQQSIKDLAKSIKENITNRLDGLMELIPQLGKAIKQLFSGDFVEAGKTAMNAVAKVGLGVDDLSGKIKKATKASKEFLAEQVKEGKLAAKVAEMRAKADIIERKLLVEKSILQSKIAQLRLKARQEDQFSAKERRAALMEAQDFENTLLDKTTEYLTLRAEAQTLENTFSRSNKENLDKEATAIAAVNNQIAVRANVARALQRELNTIAGQIKTQNSQEASAIAKIAKAEKTKADALQKASDAKEVLRLKEEELEKASGIRKIEAEIELKLLRAELGLEDPNATFEEKEEDFAKKLEALEAQFQLEQEVKATNQEKESATEAEIRAQKELDIEKHEAKIKAIQDGRISSIKLAETEAAEHKSYLRKLEQQQAVTGAQDMLGNLSQILGEGSAEAKAVALAQATISGIQGVQAAFTSGSAIPIVGMVMGPVAAGLAAAVAAKNISSIASAKTGAKRGGNGGGGGSFSAPKINTPRMPQGSAASPEINTEAVFSTQNLEGSGVESLGSGRGNSQQRVVILESDITAKQNRVSTIESESQIG